MISLGNIIEGNVKIAPTTILHPRVCIKSDKQPVSIGDNNILEELCSVIDSTVGSGNLLEVASTLENSKVGDGCIVGCKTKIMNSTIGNRCVIVAGINITDAIIPEGSSVYLVDGKWSCSKAEIQHNDQIINAYRDSLSNKSSLQCISNNFTG